MSAFLTLPTSLERAGDFSQSLNAKGGPRTIYDPYTTVLNTNTNTASRVPFALNTIPLSRQDPTAIQFMKDVWAPNGSGDNPSRTNNFKSSYYVFAHYFNRPSAFMAATTAGRAATRAR